MDPRGFLVMGSKTCVVKDLQEYPLTQWNLLQAKHGRFPIKKKKAEVKLNHFLKGGGFFPKLC